VCIAEKEIIAVDSIASELCAAAIATGAAARRRQTRELEA